MSQNYSRLLNAQLLIHFELTDQLERTKTLCYDRPLLKGKFAERLMLYDHVVTPTIDFSIVPVLVSWMGEGLFREALAKGAISFVRFRGGLGYASGAGGLGNFQMLPPADQLRPRDDRQLTAFTKIPGDAIEIWLATMLPELSARARTKIARSVLSHALIFDEFPNFEQTVAHETYMDVLHSPELRDYFGIRNTDLQRLTSVSDKDLEVFSPNYWSTQTTFKDAEVLLGMASVNLELGLVNITGATDAAFDPSIERFMIAKAKRSFSSPDLADAFTHILDVNDVPDLAQVVANKQISFEDAWRLREGASAEIFRRWFFERVADEPERAVHEYLNALSGTSWVNSAPVKVVRLLLTTVTGGLASLMLSAADSLVVGSSASGRNPKYLIDDMKRKLPRREAPARETANR